MKKYAIEAPKIWEKILPNAERIHGGDGQSNQLEMLSPLDGAAC